MVYITSSYLARASMQSTRVAGWHSYCPGVPMLISCSNDNVLRWRSQLADRVSAAVRAVRNAVQTTVA